MHGNFRPFAAGVISAAAFALAGCGGHGPNTYLMAMEPIKAKLTNAQKTFESAAKIQFDVRATSWRGDRLQVTIKGPSGTPRRCEAVVEAIDEDWTRVAPDCSKMNQGKTETQIAEMQVEEFVVAALHDQPMNNAAIAKRTGAIVIATMDDIQQRVATEVGNAAAVSEASISAADWDNTADGGWGD